MKYLFNFHKITENKQLADKYVSKYSGNFHKDKYAVYNQIKELVKDKPNLLGFFTKLAFATPEYLLNIDNLTELYNNLKLHIKDLSKNVEQYNYEELIDEIRLIEKKKVFIKFRQHLNSKQKGELENQNTEEVSRLVNLYYDKFKNFKFKISKYTLAEILDIMRSELDKISEKGYSKLISNLKSDDILRYAKDNIVVAVIPEFEYSEKYGSKDWCITEDDSIFNDYVTLSENLNIQLFIWDFNKEITDKYHMIGITLPLVYNNKHDNIDDLINNHSVSIHDMYDGEIYESNDTLSKLFVEKQFELTVNDMNKTYNGVGGVLSKYTTTYDYHQILNKKGLTVIEPETDEDMYIFDYDKFVEMGFNKKVVMNLIEKHMPDMDISYEDIKNTDLSNLHKVISDNINFFIGNEYEVEQREDMGAIRSEYITSVGTMLYYDNKRFLSIDMYGFSNITDVL